MRKSQNIFAKKNLKLKIVLTVVSIFKNEVKISFFSPAENVIQLRPIACHTFHEKLVIFDFFSSIGHWYFPAFISINKK